MNWDLLSWVFTVLLILFVIVLLCGAIKGFKVKNNSAGILYLVLAVLAGVATYAIYGEKIIGLFK